MSITFAVDNVIAKSLVSSPKSLNSDKFFKEEINAIGVKPGSIEAYNFNTENAVHFYHPNTNAFVETALIAYDTHAPLTLAPDDVWLAVCQAVTQHITINPEDCRKALVSFEGKKELIVENTDFIKGNSTNEWGREFGRFGDQIEKHIGKKRDLFDPTFSTTTIIEKAAIQVQMMAALGSYFEYTMRTCCGIPKVTLLGTSDDWLSIVNRVQAFGEFYPKWALDPLESAVTEFYNAAKGSYDINFWQNFVKVNGGSGGPYLTGWINALFPYVNKSKVNCWLQKTPNLKEYFSSKNRLFGGGPVLGDIPGAIVSVPMKWEYYSTVYRMKLITGIFGTTIEDGAYRNVIGWAVGEENTSKAT